MTCEHCQKNSPIFDLHCMGCRDRIVMAEDCKVLREREAKHIDEKFGFLPDYKREPHCGCKTYCIRKSRIKPKNEQQVDRIPKKAPGRR